MDWSFNRIIRGLNSHNSKNNVEHLAGNWIMVAALLENWHSESTWSGSGLVRKSYELGSIAISPAVQML